MDQKQKLFLTILLLSLTIMMIGFQNCSQPNGGSPIDTSNLLGSALDGGTTPQNPNILVSTNSTCTTPTSTFSTSSVIYICVQNVGGGLDYSLYNNNSSSVVDYQTIPSSKWTKNSSGWYYMPYSYPTGNPLTTAASYSVMVMNVSDNSLTATASFNVQ